MQYQTRDHRELYLYTFATRTRDTICTFMKRDGLISHVKLLGDFIFYIKNTKDVIRYDTKTKGSMLIGTTKDPVIAMHVSRNFIREWDRARMEEVKGDPDFDEEMNHEDARFSVCCLDEGENIYIFKNSTHDRA
jgi:hypothetical protein